MNCILHSFQFIIRLTFFYPKFDRLVLFIFFIIIVNFYKDVVYYLI
jgi:hypothetical protein